MPLFWSFKPVLLCFDGNWRLMKWLTLVLELCLSAVSVKMHFSCVRVEAIVNLRFLLKAAEALQLSFSRAVHPVGTWHHFTLLCSALPYGLQRCWEQETVLNRFDLSTSTWVECFRVCGSIVGMLMGCREGVSVVIQVGSGNVSASVTEKSCQSVLLLVLESWSIWCTTGMCAVLLWPQLS